MAKQAPTDELDLDAEHSGSSKKKLIIILLAGLLVLGCGGAAAYLLLLAGEDTAMEPGEAKQADNADEQADQRPLIYHALDPRFVVHLQGRPKLLQVGAQIATRDPDLVEFLQQNDPLIRDRFLSLLMSQEGSKLKERAGKEALQSDLLEAIREAAKQEGVSGEAVAVYFTSFVMQ